MSKNEFGDLGDLLMGIAFVVTIFGVLPFFFYVLYWSLTVDGFVDWFFGGVFGLIALAFVVTIVKGIRQGLAMRRIEAQTRLDLADGWTRWIVEEHFGPESGQQAREGHYPPWKGEQSIQSVVRGRWQRAGLIPQDPP